MEQWKLWLAASTVHYYIINRESSFGSWSAKNYAGTSVGKAYCPRRRCIHYLTGNMFFPATSSCPPSLYTCIHICNKRENVEARRRKQLLSTLSQMLGTNSSPPRQVNTLWHTLLIAWVSKSHRWLRVTQSPQFVFTWHFHQVGID